MTRGRLLDAGSAAAVALGLVAVATAAYAEFWAEDTDELLATATRLEVIRVTKAAGDAFEGEVVESLRGRPVGAKVKVTSVMTTLPAVGQEALTICDRWVCPRATGVDRGGYFILEAYQPMDGAQVLPGLVERSSLKALARRGKAPDLKVRVTVRFLDAPTAKAVVSGVVSAADGEGSATGAALGAGRHDARLVMSGGLYPTEHGAGVLRVKMRRGYLALIGGPLTKGPGGVYSMEAVPAQPFARTPAGLAKAVAGSAGTVPVATGHVEIDPGHGVAAGRHPLTIAVNANGDLLFRCPILAEPHPALFSMDSSKRLKVGFPASRGAPHPQVVFDLGPGRPPVPGAGPAATLAATLRAAKTRDVPVYLLATGLGGHSGYTKVGGAKLRYVPEAP